MTTKNEIVDWMQENFTLSYQAMAKWKMSIKIIVHWSLTIVEAGEWIDCKLSDTIWQEIMHFGSYEMHFSVASGYH